MDTARTVEPIYQHTKREEWGHAIQTWAGDERVRYLFEDGKARTFHRDYLKFIEPVDRSYDRARAIVRNLKTLLRATQKEDGLAAEEAPVVEPATTAKEQAAVFRHLFPEGFQGEAYKKQHRGAGKKRPAKRHRNPSIAFAQEHMERSRLESFVGKSDYLAIVKAAVETLDKTDLAAKREVKLIAPPTQEDARDLALAIFDLLHGDSEDAFDRYARVLAETMKRKPSWELVTALPALMDPMNQVPVKESVMKEQAKWLSPALRIDNVPSGDVYGRLQEMAVRLKETLEAEGLQPADMLDLRDFMWATLRPSAEPILMEVRAKAAGVEVPAS